MLSTKFQFIWESGFRGEFFQKSTNQKQEQPVAAMFVNGSELNEQSLQMTFQGCFLPSFDSFGPAVSEEKIFQKSTNQKQEWHVKEDLPQMLPTKFRFIWPSSFSGEDFKKSANQKLELPVAAMFVNGSGQSYHSISWTFHGCFLLSFSSFG